MTNDYREALELTTLDKKSSDKKTSDSTLAQQAVVINSVPVDTPVTIQSIVKSMKVELITRHQTIYIIAQAVRDGIIIKSSNILDGRRRLYRRKGVMD